MSEEIENMSKLEMASILFMTTFKEHAGDDDLLSKSELVKLINSEMCHLCEKGREKHLKEIDEFFQDMDADGSGSIDFAEFMLSMAKVTCLCYGMACEMVKQQGKK